jgi:hypothetical protein
MFTARYELSPYINQTLFLFKELRLPSSVLVNYMSRLTVRNMCFTAPGPG